MEGLLGQSILISFPCIIVHVFASANVAYVGGIARVSSWKIPQPDSVHDISACDYKYGRIDPNPCTTSATLDDWTKATKIKKNASLEIYDIIGNELKSMENINSPKVNIDLSRFVKGVYFFKAEQMTIKQEDKVCERMIFTEHN